MTRHKKMFDCFDERKVVLDDHFTIRVRKMISRISGNIVFNWRIYKDVKETPKNEPWWPDAMISCLEYEETADDAEMIARNALNSWKKDLNYNEI